MYVCIYTYNILYIYVFFLFIFDHLFHDTYDFSRYEVLSLSFFLFFSLSLSVYLYSFWHFYFYSPNIRMYMCAIHIRRVSTAHSLNFYISSPTVAFDFLHPLHSIFTLFPYCLVQDGIRNGTISCLFLKAHTTILFFSTLQKFKYIHSSNLYHII